MNRNIYRRDISGKTGRGGGDPYKKEEGRSKSILCVSGWNYEPGFMYIQVQ